MIVLLGCSEFPDKSTLNGIEETTVTFRGWFCLTHLSHLDHLPLHKDKNTDGVFKNKEQEQPLQHTNKL